MTVHYITEYHSDAVRSNGLDPGFNGDRHVVEVVPRAHEEDWKTVRTFPRGEAPHHEAIAFAEELERDQE